MFPQKLKHGNHGHSNTFRTFIALLEIAVSLSWPLFKVSELYITFTLLGYRLKLKVHSMLIKLLWRFWTQILLDNCMSEMMNSLLVRCMLICVIFWHMSIDLPCTEKFLQKHMAFLCLAYINSTFFYSRAGPWLVFQICGCRCS